jgi:hypothetical protein
MRRIFICLVLLLASVSAGTATAAPEPSLTITSRSTAETTLVVTRSITFDPSLLRVLRGGRLAGVGLPGLRLVELKVRAWTSAAGAPRVHTLAGSVTLNPGRYRLVVYGDGPTTLQPAAEGLVAHRDGCGAHHG